MSKTKPYGSYFDEDDDHKQLEPLPKKWMDASRFKVGDKIEYISGDVRVHIPCEECKADHHFHYNGRNLDRCESRNLKGEIGIVEAVHNGRGEFPPRRIEDDVETYWHGEAPGRLTVRFPFDYYGKESDGRYKPRACLLQDEGVNWRKVK